MNLDSPYHEGEIDIQNRTGERDRAVRNGGVIKDEILDGALNFIERQPFMVIASESSDKKLWASMVFGKAGFVRARTKSEVGLNLRQASFIAGDQVLQNLKLCRRIGGLFIELETRRRLKVNGEVVVLNEDEMAISVKESFPLCPKYIQRRKLMPLQTTAADDNQAATPTTGKLLSSVEIELIGKCDTMFAATSHPERGLDVSHRGGEPGFVKVVNERQLRVPDYAGNSMFNSFGNLQSDDRTGVILVDFATGVSLQILGRARVLLDQEDFDGETGGTKRFWTLDVESWLKSAIPTSELEFFDYSPFNPKAN
jgi:uncharacterized protein